MSTVLPRFRKPLPSVWPDRLSGWTLPPPSARAVGEVEAVRVFESAEAAMVFLAGTARGSASVSLPTELMVAGQAPQHPTPRARVDKSRRLAVRRSSGSSWSFGRQSTPQPASPQSSLYRPLEPP